MNWGITEENSLQHLKVIFPQLAPSVIIDSIQHPSNRDVPFNEGRLIQRCIDDLLELRTHRQNELELTSATSPNTSTDSNVDLAIQFQEQMDNVRDNLIKIEELLSSPPLLDPHISVRPESIASSSPSPSSALPCSPTPPVTPIAVAPDVMFSPSPMTAEQILQQDLLQVCALFPRADPGYVRRMLEDTGEAGEGRVNLVCNRLLETNYPKTEISSGAAPAKHSDTSTSPSTNVDFYAISGVLSDLYRKQCLQLLQYDFLKVSIKDIRHVMYYHRYHYAPSYKCIAEGLAQGVHPSDSNMSNALVTYPVMPQVSAAPALCKSTKMFIQLKLGTKSINVKLLSHGRHPACCPLTLCERLQQEVDFIKKQDQQEKQEVDRCTAISQCTEEYVQAGQTIECGCCYGDFAFDLMIQCLEGHLFCRGCIESYTREAVFGQGNANLMCLTDGCDTILPKSQLHIALPPDLLMKYEDRLKEEDLNLANLEDLVRCPHCHFAAIMDPDDKVFQCQVCLKETCRYCQIDWSEHFGIPCREMEQKDETKIRLDFEEKMSQAKIRVCHRCKANFMKLDGCNKMTCRCGAKMCYICRKPDINYNHFCQHVRDPGKTCSKCTSCFLWTKTEEDDERALQELKKEAQKARRDQGYIEEKLIGATSHTPTKRRKVN